MKASELIKAVQKISDNIGGDPDIVIALYNYDAMPVSVKEVRYWPINEGYTLIMGEEAKPF